MQAGPLAGPPECFSDGLPSAGVRPILPAARPTARKSNTDVPAARFPIHPGPGPFLVHGFSKECCQTAKQGIEPGTREQEGRNKSTRPRGKKITEEARLEPGRALSLERKTDQQEEAEGAEEESLAGIGGFTCEGGFEVFHDRVQWMDTLLSLLPPVHMHFGFQAPCFGRATLSPSIISSSKNFRPIGLSPPSSHCWKCATAVLAG